MSPDGAPDGRARDSGCAGRPGNGRRLRAPLFRNALFRGKPRKHRPCQSRGASGTLRCKPRKRIALPRRVLLSGGCRRSISREGRRPRTGAGPGRKVASLTGQGVSQGKRSPGIFLSAAIIGSRRRVAGYGSRKTEGRQAWGGVLPSRPRCREPHRQSMERGCPTPPPFPGGGRLWCPPRLPR